jgi:hypothetical protein
VTTPGYRVVSLDTAADEEVVPERASLEALMRRRPTPHTDARVIRTPNGNLVTPVAR